jgi:deazaflavin-dependent oxidoreductase (nitroreductase family)
MNWLARWVDRIATSRRGQLVYVRLVPPVDRLLMRLSSGRCALSPGPALAVLITHGARSGRLRHTPLGFAADGDDVILIASNAARSWHPAWYHNLRRNPECEVLFRGGRRGAYRAEEATGEARERLWRRACEVFAGFDAYPQRTGGREIPVMRLRPRSETAGR